MYSEWKKEIEKKLKIAIDKQEEIDKIPAVIKRCPKCHELSLEYDNKIGRIFCTKCSFEEYIPMTK